MTTAARDVSHDHGITREIYEVTRIYGETVQRLRNAGTDENAISEDFYRAAMKVYAETLAAPDTLTELRPDQKREALCTLAAIVLRWARKTRIDIAPHVVTVPREKGDTHHDAKHDRYDAQRLPCSDC